MKTFTINTLGCKVNQYESQQIRQLLEDEGLHQTSIENSPDIVLINTCCVTHIASAKSRQYIRKAIRINPKAKIIVTGCLAKVDIGELNIPTNSILMVGSKDQLPITLRRVAHLCSDNDALESLHKHQTNNIKPKTNVNCKNKNNLSNHPGLPTLTDFKGQTRAFLKVQDGCDGRCSYCIIPRTRPTISSKSISDAVEEAKCLVKAGKKEIVLTGIYLGAYGLKTTRRRKWGSEKNEHFLKLVEKLAQVEGLERIRLSSVEPGDVTEELMELYRKYPNLLPHLHLSLQSGSDAVLRRMCRQYRSGDYFRTCEMITQSLDRPALTTDIIVGFPGESDEEFLETLEFAKRVGFSKIHVFSYSARQGTAAKKLQSVVNNGVIKKRSEVLRELDERMQGRFREQFLGETVEVLAENVPMGRCERYFEVKIEQNGEKIEKNGIYRVKITKNGPKYAIGEVV